MIKRLLHISFYILLFSFSLISRILAEVLRRDFQLIYKRDGKTDKSVLQKISMNKDQIPEVCFIWDIIVLQSRPLIL